MLGNSKKKKKRSKIIQFSPVLAWLTRVSHWILSKVKFKGQTTNDDNTMTLNEYSDILRLIFEEWYGPLLDHYGIHVRYLRYHPFFKYFADHFQRNIWRRSFKKVPFYEKRPRETPRAPNVSSSTFSREFRKGPSEAHIFTPQRLQKPFFPEPL